MKKSFAFILAAIVLLTVSGCGNQKQTSEQKGDITSAQGGSDDSSKDSKSIDLKPQENDLWNNDKSRQLESFMKDWQATMHQEYQNYYPGKDVSYYGITYPSSLGSGNIAVNDHKVSMGWSNDGLGKHDFNVVAIYSDIDHAKMGAHLYFFAIASNKKPIVLITEQNQGTPDMLIHFNPTKNTDLEQGFEKIANSNVQ
ncbi:DUF4767 domain-containing protein [Pediococcus argentinicus]|uniref:DUF4767 domain-containing protein n=1 Tax=Pediococcus argentinicus TaxID=480391 RepID=A0A0R2NK85_9LACO|nr:DUF4767 domain-containing protein [Pediococcus argentinicus]KRO26148.1 hypothetical protein IV88_GL000608 [Pediococcus argentinicus]NKZ21646.1 DUF4767 domain-containing protein [Pediococcus argentinicus]GEP18767.1 hypothetical protein LSA03_01510 [Pediococcus argentinicus]